VLHQKLKELRKSKKLTQEDAAKKLGIARTTYSGYERGTSEPDLDGLKNISNLYGVSVEYLLSNDQKPNKVESEYSLPESEYDRVIKEAEEKYGVDLRDDPNVHQMMRELILGIAKMQQEKK